VPEKHIQNTKLNWIRLLTPDVAARVAFGRFRGRPGDATSSFRMKPLPICDSGICLSAGVMYRGIFDCFEGAAFDPYVKEVGKR